MDLVEASSSQSVGVNFALDSICPVRSLNKHLFYNIRITSVKCVTTFVLNYGLEGILTVKEIPLTHDLCLKRTMYKRGFELFFFDTVNQKTRPVTAPRGQTRVWPKKSTGNLKLSDKPPFVCLCAKCPFPGPLDRSPAKCATNMQKNSGKFQTDFPHNCTAR